MYIHICTCMYTYTPSISIWKLIVGIVTRDCGGWEVSWSTICKIQNRERQVRNSIRVRSLRRRTADVQGQAKMSQLKQKEQNCLFSIFLLYLGPQWIRSCWPALVRTIFSTQSAEANIDLLQNHSCRHTQILFYQLSGHPLAQPNWQVKLTIVATHLLTYQNTYRTQWREISLNAINQYFQCDVY